MGKLLKFERDWDVALSPIQGKTFPKGWSGEVPDEIAEKALKAKAAIRVGAPADEAEPKKPAKAVA